MSTRTAAKREYHRTYMRDRYANDAEYRERHKKVVAATKVKLRQRLRALIAEGKADGCCTCPERDAACLDYHHVEPKEFHIATGLNRAISEDRMRREIAKCVVLCANCHRKLHAGLIVLPNLDRAVEKSFSPAS